MKGHPISFLSNPISSPFACKFSYKSELIITWPYRSINSDQHAPTLLFAYFLMQNRIKSVKNSLRRNILISSFIIPNMIPVYLLLEASWSHWLTCLSLSQLLSTHQWQSTSILIENIIPIFFSLRITNQNTRRGGLLLDITFIRLLTRTLSSCWPI